MMPWAHWLHDAGYSLLMFDFRAHGESGGDWCTLGRNEPLDVLSAVNWLSERYPGMPLGALGFSMGGAACLLAAAEDERLAAVASHAGFADLHLTVDSRCRRHFGPLSPIAKHTLWKAGLRWFPFPAHFPRPEEAVARVDGERILISHCPKDPIVKPVNFHRLCQANRRIQALMLSSGGHKYPRHRDEAVYRRHLLEFLERRLAAV
jgi:predicted alpha/beta-fold hydrolase